MALAVAALPARVLVPRSGSRTSRSGISPPRLSVVIVNYGHWEETARLVRQIRQSESSRAGTIEVVVVDNHSPPHPWMRRLRRWPGVSLRRWGRNRGFARAANEGCRLSQGDWVLLLNPDVTLEADFLEGVLALADQLSREDPRAGIVGFHLRNPDGSLQLSAGPYPTLAGTLAGLALPRARRKYRVFRPRRRGRVPWVTGCCLLVRQECLRRLGGFDEDFFLYYEDVDFCRRARAEGWTVWYEPTLRVIHHRPLHLRTVPAPLRFITRHALLTYAGKHWPEWQVPFLAGIVFLEAWFQEQRAARRGDTTSASHYAELKNLAADLARGRAHEARRRLARVVRREELRRAS